MASCVCCSVRSLPASRVSRICKFHLYRFKLHVCWRERAVYSQQKPIMCAHLLDVCSL